MKRFSILANKYHLQVINDYASYLDASYTLVPYSVAYNSIKHFTSDMTNKQILRAVVNKVYGV